MMSPPKSAVTAPRSDTRTRIRVASLPHLSSHGLALLLFTLSGVLAALSVIFLVLSWTTPVPDTWGFRGQGVFIALVYGVVGQLLARRRPQNPIGWLFLFGGLINAFVEFLIEYAAYTLLIHNDQLSGGVLAAWVASWLWFVWIAMTLYIFLIFPTGRLPSERWQPVAWMTIFTYGLSTIGWMLRPGPLYFAPYLDNPYASSAIIHSWLAQIAGIGIAFSSLLVGVCVVWRFVHAQGIERLQLKWFAYAAAMITIIGIMNAIFSSAGLVGTGPKFFQFFTFGVWIVIAFTVAFAILRYHLWDIDVIINRSLVYGTLSASIVVTYVLSVGALGRLLNTNVNLAAIMITAALTVLFFQPLRARLQPRINRAMFGADTVPTPQHEIEELDSDSELPSRWRWLTLAHAAWLVGAALVAIVLLGALPIYYSHLVQPIRSDPYGLGPFNLPFQALLDLGDLVATLMSFALAIMLFWRKPNDRIALFVSYFLLFTSVVWSYSLDRFLTAYFGAPSTFPFWANLSTPPTILLLSIFPNGRFVPRWTRWVFLISIFATLVRTVEWVQANYSIPVSLEASAIGVVNYSLYMLVIYAQVYRYRRVSNHAERQQTKWWFYGLLVTLVLSIAASLIYQKFSSPLLNVMPIFLTIAILRSHLWDIDVIINRTLVYGTLTISTMTLYAFIVGYLGNLVQSIDRSLIAFLTTGLVAVIFQPLRERLQRGVNRLMYGERDEPYTVIARLGQNIETTVAPDAILIRLIHTIAEALKLPYVAIEEKQGDDVRIAAAYGEPGSQAHRIPLTYQAESIGNLVVAPRSVNEPLSPADLNLLRIIAQQAGMAVHAVQLTEDLQRSRERLVVAREEERRRIRRDLHDGLGPALASLAMQADNAREWTHIDPSKTEDALAEITTKAQAALQDIRRLVYDLRPPALDELGLVGALRQTVANFPNGLRVEIDAPNPLPQLSAAVEVACYRIAQETLNNVVHHSHAQNCNVKISIQDDLCLEIGDDGVGLPPNVRAGVGLISMRERAAELGGSCMIESTRGGTRVIARLPLARQ